MSYTHLNKLTPVLHRGLIGLSNPRCKKESSKSKRELMNISADLKQKEVNKLKITFMNQLKINRLSKKNRSMKGN